MVGAAKNEDTTSVASVIRSKHQLRSKRQLGEPFPTAHDAAFLSSIAEAAGRKVRLATGQGDCRKSAGTAVL